MVIIQLVKDGGFGKWQKGENIIENTFDNAEEATKFLLNMLNDNANVKQGNFQSKSAQT